MSIKRVGVVGSGIMGSGIAEVAAANGHEVVLRSRSRSTADAMVSGLERSLSRQIEKGKRTEAERDEILGRVRAVPCVTSTETFVYLKLRKQTYSWGTR